MKKQDKEILREIQKGANTGLLAIDAIMTNVKDKDMLKELSKQSMMYSDFYDRATNQLRSENERFYKNKDSKKIMMRSGIIMRTMMDHSNSHVAELMIKGANMGLTDMYKVMNHNKDASKNIYDLAKDMMDMEEKSITTLREYL